MAAARYSIHIFQANERIMWIHRKERDKTGRDLQRENRQRRKTDDGILRKNGKVKIIAAI